MDKFATNPADYADEILFLYSFLHLKTFSEKLYLYPVYHIHRNSCLFVSYLFSASWRSETHQTDTLYAYGNHVWYGDYDD